jgi:hypothetical protein
VSVIACRQLLAAAQDGQRNGATLPYSEASAMMAANARRTAIHKLTQRRSGSHPQDPQPALDSVRKCAGLPVT